MINPYYTIVISILITFFSHQAISADSFQDGTKENTTEVVSENINKEVKKKSKPISIDDFNRIKSRLGILSKMSDEVKESYRKLAEAEENLNSAEKNFNFVKNAKQLVENIQDNEECYITYFRIKELDSNIKSISSGSDIKILESIEKPLKKFLKKCKNMRLDLLKEYEENK